MKNTDPNEERMKKRSIAIFPKNRSSDDKEGKCKDSAFSLAQAFAPGG
jgi:hypothetical protein